MIFLRILNRKARGCIKRGCLAFKKPSYFGATVTSGLLSNDGLRVWCNVTWCQSGPAEHIWGQWGICPKIRLSPYSNQGGRLYPSHRLVLQAPLDLKMFRRACSTQGIDSDTYRPVVPGGWHPQILAGQLTLSQPRGTDYAHQIILAPPDCQTFRRP